MSGGCRDRRGSASAKSLPPQAGSETDDCGGGMDARREGGPPPAELREGADGADQGDSVPQLTRVMMPDNCAATGRHAGCRTLRAIARQQGPDVRYGTGVSIRDTRARGRLVALNESCFRRSDQVGDLWDRSGDLFGVNAV